MQGTGRRHFPFIAQVVDADSHPFSSLHDCAPGVASTPAICVMREGPVRALGAHGGRGRMHVRKVAAFTGDLLLCCFLPFPSTQSPTGQSSITKAVKITVSSLYKSSHACKSPQLAVHTKPTASLVYNTVHHPSLSLPLQSDALTSHSEVAAQRQAAADDQAIVLGLRVASVATWSVVVVAPTRVVTTFVVVAATAWCRRVGTEQWVTVVGVGRGQGQIIPAPSMHITKTAVCTTQLNASSPRSAHKQRQSSLEAR